MEPRSSIHHILLLYSDAMWPLASCSSCISCPSFHHDNLYLHFVTHKGPSTLYAPLLKYFVPKKESLMCRMTTECIEHSVYCNCKRVLLRIITKRTLLRKIKLCTHLFCIITERLNIEM